MKCHMCKKRHISYKKVFKQYGKRDKENNYSVQFCEKTKQQVICYKQPYKAYMITIINNLDPNLLEKYITTSQKKMINSKKFNTTTINGTTYIMLKSEAARIDRLILNYAKENKSLILDHLKTFTFNKVFTSTIYYNPNPNNKLDVHSLEIDIESKDLNSLCANLL